VKTFLKILGFAFLAFALIGVASEIDDAREGKTKNQAVGVAMIIIFGGGGLLMIRAGSKKPPVARPMDPPPPISKPAPSVKKPDDDFV
jgi:hypothetical protein